jgi:hypothetical protein
MRMKVDEEENRATCEKWELSGCRETHEEGATADWKVAISESNDCLQPFVTENTLCTSSALAAKRKARINIRENESYFFFAIACC